MINRVIEALKTNNRKMPGPVWPERAGPENARLENEGPKSPNVTVYPASSGPAFAALWSRLVLCSLFRRLTFSVNPSNRVRCQLVTSRDSGKYIATGLVRPSIRLCPLYIVNQLTSDRDYCTYMGHNYSSPGIKSQGRAQGRRSMQKCVCYCSILYE